MGSFAQSGRTVLFVSHNMEAIRTLCQRGIWLKDGGLHKDGRADEIVEDYFNDTSSELSFSCANPDYGLIIQKVVLKNDRGEESSQFRPGEDLIVEINLRRAEAPGAALCCARRAGDQWLLLYGQYAVGRTPARSLGWHGKLACRFKSVPLFPQSYSVKMSVRTKNGNDMIVNYQEVAYFNVVGDLTEYGFKGEFLSRASHSTSVVVPYEWYLPDGTIAAVSLARPHHGTSNTAARIMSRTSGRLDCVRLDAVQSREIVNHGRDNHRNNSSSRRFEANPGQEHQASSRQTDHCIHHCRGPRERFI